jgi:hypothetical protein
MVPKNLLLRGSLQFCRKANQTTRVRLLDATTLAVKSYFAVPTQQSLLNYPVLWLSPDNTKVYLTDAKGADVADAYDISTGKLTGWIPQLNLASPGSYTSIQPLYQGSLRFIDLLTAHKRSAFRHISCCACIQWDVDNLRLEGKSCIGNCHGWMAESEIDQRS